MTSQIVRGDERRHNYKAPRDKWTVGLLFTIAITLITWVFMAGRIVQRLDDINIRLTRIENKYWGPSSLRLN